ncbi:MAG: class I SAM-dependent methyltransferase [Magnetospirillum sp.]|nr:class I SAM-dependent methyltransferase [Magnetospirillum sp.]
MSDTALKDVRSHFAFGENWASYARTIDSDRIAEAEKGLLRLAGDGELAGKRFLDIGCGSGLHALAALRLGVAEVVAVDIDPNSVATTRNVLEENAPGKRWRAEEVSVFTLTPDTFGLFGVVYSWGVLHHTGSMVEAIERASALVAPGGVFIVALYRKTRLCWAWKIEKRWYAKASARAQRLAQGVYIALMRLLFALRWRDFNAYVANYRGNRGMNYRHDVHDWMGGHPYESISPAEVATLMERLGFEPVRSFTQPGGLGLSGSGCDEFVYRRRA